MFVISGIWLMEELILWKNKASNIIILYTNNYISNVNLHT